MGAEGGIPCALPASGCWAAFSAPKEGWTCDTCSIHNAVNAVQCAACETPKPGAATGAASGLGFTFGGAAVPAPEVPSAAAAADVDVKGEESMAVADEKEAEASNTSV